MKPEQIAAILRTKQETHPELARALTWPAMQRICQREGVRIRLSPEPMTRPAQLVPFMGRWTIMVSRDTPRRRHTYLAAHELGHLWLHHDQSFDRAEIVYNMSHHWPEDPREDDAEVFAALILAGPVQARAMLPETESRLHFALRTVRRTPRGPR